MNTCHAAMYQRHILLLLDINQGLCSSGTAAHLRAGCCCSNSALEDIARLDGCLLTREVTSLGKTPSPAIDPAAKVARSSVDLLEVQAGAGDPPSSGSGTELHLTCIILANYVHCGRIQGL